MFIILGWLLLVTFIIHELFYKKNYKVSYWVEMTLGLIMCAFLPLPLAIIGMIVLSMFISSHDEKDQKLKDDIKELEEENLKNKQIMNSPIIDTRTIEHLEYLMNDPDLSKFKARCRARGEVF